MKIQHKFIALSLMVTIISMDLVVIIVYKQVKSEEEIKAFDTCYKTLASVESSRIYVREKLRPIFSKFNGENIFVPEIMSASFVAREQFEIFLKKYPEYYVKFASINPRNPLNQADKIELQIIEEFKQNPTLKEWQGIVERNNIKYFTVAKPLRFKNNCLRCHGIQQDAPSSLISRYGNKAGFGVSLNDVTIYSIGVPTNVTFAVIWEKALLYIVPIIFLSLLMQVFSIIIFKRLTCEIEYSANHDTLTGLPSLRLAKEQLELIVSLAKRNKQKVALMFLDLDGFKQVNDTYGHDVGDEVLIQVSNKIKTVIRQSDIACRLGGDEFILILPGLAEVSMVKQVAGRLVEKISEDIIIDNFNLQVGVSIGVAIYPDHATNTTELRKKADEVMYSIKRAGKNNFGIASK